jgi:hypothetical protein
MKLTTIELKRYDAETGFVFDWKEPHFTKDENGNEIQEHLNASTLFIGNNDTIENYIEVEAPVPESSVPSDMIFDGEKNEHETM